jgi:hypothetical protein
MVIYKRCEFITHTFSQFPTGPPEIRGFPIGGTGCAYKVGEKNKEDRGLFDEREGTLS